MPRASLYHLIKSGKIRVTKSWATPVEHRFWARVNKEGPIHPVVGQCWQFAVNPSAIYGTMYINSKITYVHRYSYTLHIGEIPEGLEVMHSCDNPACVNPKHLSVGTPKDNTDDRDNKGRQAKGKNNGWAKLTEKQVQEIRRRYIPFCKKNGGKVLADEFGVSYQTIKRILNRTAWKHT